MATFLSHRLTHNPSDVATRISRPCKDGEHIPAGQARSHELLGDPQAWILGPAKLDEQICFHGHGILVLPPTKRLP